MIIEKRLSPAKISEIKAHYFDDLEVIDGQFYKTIIHIALAAKGTPFLLNLPMKLKFGPHLLMAKINLTKFYIYALVMFLAITSLFFVVYSNIQVAVAMGGGIAIVFYSMLYRSAKKSIKKFNFFVD
jgi:hypothetical protein